MGKKCDKCRYFLCEDEGYSNYTVEGWTAHCLLGLNPGFPSDRWYGEDSNLGFAEQCSSYTEGEHTTLDVERLQGDAENYSEDPEIKTLLRKWEGREDG